MTRRISATGVVRSITYPGIGQTPRVLVHLQIGSEIVVLYFMSRRDLHCLDIGSKVRVRGALQRVHGVPTVFNPVFRVVEERDE
ncbi:hypothetical protein [Trueperella sp. LYQ143]|uniref:hypothetical protein n=1 Tax=unclassified Trueperella TaxID=2630174 RepID=UPI003983A654